MYYIKTRMYYLHAVAAFSRTSAGVKRVNVPTKLAHECLAEELVGNADALELLEKAKRDGDLPPSYFDHPIVQQHADDGEPVWPLALYIDGIQLQDREGVIAVFIYCVITGVRHLLGLFKKHELCRCGCRGFCSLAPLWAMAHWSLVCCARNEWPANRHDELLWDVFDNVRRAMAGSALGLFAALIFVKSDMGEWPNTFFFPAVNAIEHDCPLC